MKLNLGCGADVRQQGYINIDLKPNQQHSPEVYRQGDARSLDWLCENQTVEEILAMHVLNYMPVAQVPLSLKNWIDKLCNNGVLKVSVPDVNALAKMFANDQLSTREFVTSVFGTQQDEDICRSAMDATLLIKILEEYGLIVKTKRYDGIMFYVEAEKVSE